MQSHEEHLISKSGNKVEYRYNSSGKTHSITESKWLFSEEQWQPTKRMINYYNPSGVLSADTLFYKYTDLNSWIALEKTEYSYNATGNLLADTSYTKQKDLNEWQYAKTTIYTYTNGYMEQSITSKWNSQQADFIPYTKTQNLYNEGCIYDISNYEWNINNNNWEKLNEKELGFDNNNNIKSYTYHTWDTDRSKVMNVFTFDYTYSHENLYLPHALGNDIKQAYHHKITRKQALRANAVTNEMELINETAYFYSTNETTSVFSPDFTSKVVVYPNPASDYVQVDLPENVPHAMFELYHVNGQKVMSELVNSNESVSLENLNRGLYLYRIRLASQFICGKLSKE